MTRQSGRAAIAESARARRSGSAWIFWPDRASARRARLVGCGGAGRVEGLGAQAPGYAASGCAVPWSVGAGSVGAASVGAGSVVARVSRCRGRSLPGSVAARVGGCRVVGAGLSVRALPVPGLSLPGSVAAPVSRCARQSLARSVSVWSVSVGSVGVWVCRCLVRGVCARLGMAVPINEVAFPNQHWPAAVPECS